jgi:hypothetical protein
MPNPPFIQRDPEAETRTRRALDQMAVIFNDLIRSGTLAFGPGGGVVVVPPAQPPATQGNGYFVPFFGRGDDESNDPILMPPPAGSSGTGPTGSQGVPGAYYFFNDEGEEGIQGVPGVPGQQGPQGIPGTGLQGVPGAYYFIEVEGEEGLQGTPGIPGPVGPTGGQGLQGVPGAYYFFDVEGEEGLQGVPGLQGIQGPVGSTGLQGVPGAFYFFDVEGEEGIQGVPGVQGIQGPQGVQGATGSAGPPANYYYHFEDVYEDAYGYTPAAAATGGTTYTGTLPIIVTGSVLSFAATIPFAETVQLTNATTTGFDVVLSVDHESSGTPANGFGGAVSFLLQDSTTASQLAAQWQWQWSTAAHATRIGQVMIGATNAVGTAFGIGLSITSGSAPTIGFLSSSNAPVVVQTGDIGAALVSFGLMTAPTLPSSKLTGTTTVQYICLQDQETQNTGGGAFTSGSWVTRVLNTKVVDTGSNCTLASNQFTLSAGTYRIRASAPAALVNNHQIRLQNITAGTTLIVGTSEYANVAGVGQSRSFVMGRFTIAASQALAIQHQCNTSNALTTGLGAQANFTTEVYCVVELEKEAT